MSFTSSRRLSRLVQYLGRKLEEILFSDNREYFLMLRAVPDWKLVQLVSSSLTSFGPKAIKGRSKFSTEATLVVVMVV